METDALVINQTATSGALTRIVEHLIAGIPVVASYGAARDYYQNPDIRVFDSWEALKGILEEFQPYVPQMPQRNKACQDLFIDTIIELLSETQRT